MELPIEASHLTPIQRAFNKAMSSVRIKVEWVFKYVKQYFTLVDNKRKWM